MILSLTQFFQKQFSRLRLLRTVILLVAIALLSWVQFLGTPSTLAGLNDDKFDGNIFALYGGDGGLVPARSTIHDAFARKKPVLLVFFLDDSSDCKQFALVVSRLQAFYAKAAAFIPVNVDTLSSKSSPTPEEAEYYYEGVVPQTLIIDSNQEVVFNAKGSVSFEEVDDKFREVFDLLPRSESVELRRRLLNEFSSEIETQSK